MGRQRRQRRKNKISPAAVLPTTFSHTSRHRKRVPLYSLLLPPNSQWFCNHHHHSKVWFSTSTSSEAISLPRRGNILHCLLISQPNLPLPLALPGAPTAFGCCFVEPIKRRGNSSSKKSCWLGCERAKQKDRQRTLRGFWCFCAFLDEGDDEDEDEDEGGDQVLK